MRKSRAQHLMAVTHPLTLAHGLRSPPRSQSRRTMVPRTQFSQIQTPVRRRTPRIAGIGPGDGRPRCIASIVSSLQPSARAPRYARTNLGGARRRGWYVAIGPPSGPRSIRRRRRSARVASRRATPRPPPAALRSRSAHASAIGAPLTLRHARHQPSAASDPSTPPAMVRARAGPDPPLSASGHAAPRHVSSQQCSADDPRTLSPSVPRPGRAPFAASAAPPAPLRQRRSARVAPGPLPAPLRQRPGHAASPPAPQLKIGPRSMPPQRPAPTPSGRTCVTRA